MDRSISHQHQESIQNTSLLSGIEDGKPSKNNSSHRLNRKRVSGSPKLRINAIYLQIKKQMDQQQELTQRVHDALKSSQTLTRRHLIPNYPLEGKRRSSEPNLIQTSHGEISHEIPRSPSHRFYSESQSSGMSSYAPSPAGSSTDLQKQECEISRSSPCLYSPSPSPNSSGPIRLFMLDAHGNQSPMLNLCDACLQNIRRTNCGKMRNSEALHYTGIDEHDVKGHFDRYHRETSHDKPMDTRLNQDGYGLTQSQVQSSPIEESKRTYLYQLSPTGGIQIYSETISPHAAAHVPLTQQEQSEAFPVQYHRNHYEHPPKTYYDSHQNDDDSNVPQYNYYSLDGAVTAYPRNVDGDSKNHTYASTSMQLASHQQSYAEPYINFEAEPYPPSTSTSSPRHSQSFMGGQETRIRQMDKLSLHPYTRQRWEQSVEDVSGASIKIPQFQSYSFYENGQADPDNAASYAKLSPKQQSCSEIKKVVAHGTSVMPTITVTSHN